MIRSHVAQEIRDQQGLNGGSRYGSIALVDDGTEQISIPICPGEIDGRGEAIRFGAVAELRSLVGSPSRGRGLEGFDSGPRSSAKDGYRPC